MAIEIGSIGYNSKHEKDYYMDMPTGPGAFLFLLVKTPALFLINGKTFKVEKNSYVLLNKDTPCNYRGNRDIYIDDWFYFGMDDSDKQFLSDMNIELDKPVPLSKIDELSSLIHKIAFELFSTNQYHQEIKNHLTYVFFYELARQITAALNTSPDLLSTKNEKLTYLRTQLFQNPAMFENVDAMADFMNLTTSGFQHLYINVFGHGVIKDVIAGRIKLAKELLKTSSLTITEIAEKCGYKTEYHFMRQFKQVTGITPTTFRNSDTWNQIEESR